MEQLITFETAKLAKEKGYTLLGKGYTDKGERIIRMKGEAKIPAPTQSLLQKWLREVHNIHIEISNYYKDRWYWKLSYCQTYELECNVFKSKIFNVKSRSNNLELSSFEHALEVGLFEALKLI